MRSTSSPWSTARRGRRLALAVVLLVGAPIVALGWLGVRRIEAEHQAASARVRALLEGSLDDSVDRLNGFLATRERALRELLAAAPTDPEGLRRLRREQSWIAELVVVDRDRGSLVHPDPLGSISSDETAFLRRTRGLWDRRPWTGALGAEEGTSAGRATPTGGWSTWFRGDGQSIFYWWPREEVIVGAELDEARLLADCIGRLPGSEGGAPEPSDGVARLVGPSGEVLYQWGSRPGAEGPPTVRRVLAPPLGAWSLELVVPSVAGEAGPAQVALVAWLLLGTLVLGGLALFVVRETSRELRLAAQRVSFVNQVSHELKTPLTNLRLFGELLEDRLGREGEAKAARWARIVASESRRLSRLIDNVLVLGRQERRQLEVRPRPGRVDEIVASVVESSRPSLAERGLEVEVEGEARTEVLVDPDALEQVVWNLLANAEKYAATGGLVRVVLSQTGAETAVEVIDRGPGIPRGQEERIFETFYRGSDRLTDGVSGAGIGLAVGREIARRHGGDLVVVPNEDGARFRLVLACPLVADGAEVGGKESS